MAAAIKVKRPAKSAKVKRHEQATAEGVLDLFANYDLRHPDGGWYSPLLSDADLECWASRIAGADRLCLDIETEARVGRPESSLNPWEGEVRLIQMGLVSGDVLILDCQLCGDRSEFWMVMGSLKDRCASPDCLIVGHGLKFEMIWLRQHYGFEFERIACTELTSRVLWAGLSNFKIPMLHSLAAVSRRLLGRSVDKTEQVSNWRNPKLTQSQIDYATEDARLPLLCLGKLVPLLKEWGLVDIAQLEFNALICYTEMEVEGIPVNRDRLSDLLVIYRDAFEIEKAKYDEVFPGIGLFSSAKGETGVDGFILQGDYDFPSTLWQALHKKTGEYAPSLDAEYLETLVDGIPAIKSLLMARALNTSINYMLNVQLSIGKGSIARPGYRSFSPQGRGRSTSGSAGESSPKLSRQKTGEVLSVNIQNCPTSSKARYRELGLPSIRSVFAVGEGTPYPGRVMQCSDFPAAHGRIAASASQDPLLISSYWDDTVDLHCDLAALLANQNGIPWTGPQLKENREGPRAAEANRYRDVAKALFYTWLNGGGVKRFEKAIVASGLKCESAEILRDSLQSRFVGLNALNNQVRSRCKNRSLWRSFNVYGIQQPHLPCRSIDGRLIWVPVWDGEYGEGANPNDAIMTQWMGPESTAKKRALVSARKLMKENPQWGAALWLDCHDEIGIHCLESHAPDCFPAIDAAMTAGLASVLGESVPAIDKPYKFVLNTDWSQCK